tara:strand:+ start:317 stop:469 length:153 start_codon:yes stop_codon:yes gene_type:complete
MRFKSFLIAPLLLIVFSCTKSLYPWFNGTLEEAYDSVGNRIVFLDFYADW